MRTLAAWMADKGIDDRELARQAEVNRSTISRLRRGLAVPTPKVAETLRRITGITPNDFHAAALAAREPA
jgi:transcriptional regulator with XRE-family HTH domain